MPEKLDLGSTVLEVMALKQKFENIKSETEDFLIRSKKLSESGLQEAKELIDLAKVNWQSVLTSLGTLGLTSFLSKAMATSKSQAPPMKKAKKAKKTVSKKATSAKSRSSKKAARR